MDAFGHYEISKEQLVQMSLPELVARMVEAWKLLGSVEHDPMVLQSGQSQKVRDARRLLDGRTPVF